MEDRVNLVPAIWFDSDGDRIPAVGVEASMNPLKSSTFKVST
jgi:hypothetical protein